MPLTLVVQAENTAQNRYVPFAGCLFRQRRAHLSALCRPHRGMFLARDLTRSGRDGFALNRDESLLIRDRGARLWDCCNRGRDRNRFIWDSCLVRGTDVAVCGMAPATSGMPFGAMDRPREWFRKGVPWRRSRPSTGPLQS